MPRKVTTSDWVEMVRDIHSSRYTYDRTVYTASREKLIVTCSVHGDFTITANKHQQGQGCRACKEATFAEQQVTKKRKAAEDFASEASEVHRNRYTYGNVEYNGNKSLVSITCQTHGDFMQSPNKHKLGRGCPKCHSYTGRTIIYLAHIESHGEQMLKIGVTNFDLAKRFSDGQYPDQHATEIATLEFKERRDAETIEAYLHAKHKRHQFTPKVKFAGHTECFNIEALETIRQDFGV